MGVSVTDITRKKAVAIALCSGQLCELACLYTVYNTEKEGTEVESSGRAQSCNDRPSRWLKMMAKSFFLHGHWLFHSHWLVWRHLGVISHTAEKSWYTTELCQWVVMKTMLIYYIVKYWVFNVGFFAYMYCGYTVCKHLHVQYNYHSL